VAWCADEDEVTLKRSCVAEERAARAETLGLLERENRSDESIPGSTWTLASTPDLCIIVL
jgi:hypothetical protein